MSRALHKSASLNKPSSKPAANELEDQIHGLAVSGTFAKAGRKLIKDQLRAGVPVTYAKGDDIVREHPDGRLEIIGRVEKSSMKTPPGVEVIPSN